MKPTAPLRCNFSDIATAPCSGFIFVSLDLMRLPKFRYTISAGATLGFVIPLIVTVLSQLHIFSVPERLLLFIWPSSIMLMATETLGHSPQAFAILAWSITWNVFLYVLLFTFIWCVGWVLRAWRASLRDGSPI
jgi:hypothetical protein